MADSRRILIHFSYPAIGKPRVNRRLPAAARGVSGVTPHELHEEDPATVPELLEWRGDETRYIAVVRQRMEIRNQAVLADRKSCLTGQREEGWDTGTLAKEVRGGQA